MAKHAGRVGLPGLSVAFALAHVLGDDRGVFAVFAVNFAGARAFLFVVRELHAVELRMFIDNAGPSINTDDRDNPSFIGECVNLFCPWVQAVLVGDDQQGCKLLVRDVATFERCILQRIHQVCTGIHAEASGQFPGHGGKCSTHC
ncbi:Uncharacterised protein [Enterobacter hormaechei]|nr:Uncharacterised protein [Enterobacter hormaechei]